MTFGRRTVKDRRPGQIAKSPEIDVAVTTEDSAHMSCKFFPVAAIILGFAAGAAFPRYPAFADSPGGALQGPADPAHAEKDPAPGAQSSGVEVAGSRISHPTTSRIRHINPPAPVFDFEIGPEAVSRGTEP
jgi:hypothetical protein